MKHFKFSQNSIILAILAILFFFVYSWFALTVVLPDKQQYNDSYIANWPDASANYFFIKKFISTTSFVAPEPLNDIAENIVHPRSANIVDGKIVPMGFLGMLILYGWLGKILGGSLILLLTPLFATLGVLFFYGLVKQIFNKKTALISASLLFTLAPYWYYASLPMLPNILFVFMLLGGLYFYSKQSEDKDIKTNYLFACLSGLFIGWALITRPIEFIWVGMLLIIPLFFHFKKKYLPQLFLFFICMIIPLGIMLLYNKQIYGEYLTLGYLKMNISGGLLQRVPAEFKISSSSSIKSYIRLMFVPFGLNPDMILINFKNYFSKFLTPYLALFIFGAGAQLFPFPKRLNKKRLSYYLAIIAAGVWLIVYYGSWLFSDPLVLKYNTIGSSYVRYWLPLYILILPTIAHVICRFTTTKRNKKLNYLLISLLLVVVAYFSFSLVYKTPGDGLLSQKEIILTYYRRAKKVDQIVESEALIISDREDKLFFPRKKVVTFNLDYSIFPQLKKITNQLPIYYLTMMPDQDIDYINNRKIKSLNLKLVEPRIIDEQFRLFKLIEASR